MAQSLRPPAELAIEREANLREQKKKILQRLKMQPDPEKEVIQDAKKDDMSFGNVVGQNSPRTSRRLFGEDLQFHSIPENDREMTEKQKVWSNPQIVLQSPRQEDNIDSSRNTTRVERQRNTVEDNIKPSFQGLNFEAPISMGYVPSFQLETPIRGRPDNTKNSLKRELSTESPKLTKKHYSQTNQGLKNSEGKQVGNHRWDLPSINIESTDSLANNSSLRRSASYGNINSVKDVQERPVWSSAENRSYLNVGNELRKASSLPSIYDEVNSSYKSDEKFGLTTGFAKRQQERLEKDFQRVEENLNRTFNELRRYLKTS